MSFTTTNMSGLRTWGFERGDAEMRVALQAGWRRSDLAWERLMEAANLAWLEGRAGESGRKFLAADLVARLRFGKGDPRRATAAACRARLAERSGKAAGTLQARALREFGEVKDFVQAMQISPRSRSSLFHLRMEALHRETYHDNLRLRLGKIADETREHLEALSSGHQPAHRLYSRWRGEKPGVFDDTRKLLGACLLIVE